MVPFESSGLRPDDPFLDNTEIIANNVITRKTCIIVTASGSMFDFLQTENGSKFTCKKFHNELVT
jgi:hypothetical protein